MRNHFLRATPKNGSPPPPPTTDSNFKQVALLLHGDGTNGSQNNTFVDSSSNNFAVTRNGNTTQGTFTPFSQDAGYWSNYFVGTGANLRVPAGSAFAYGTGDFTVEGWFYPTATTPSFGGILYGQTVFGTNHFVVGYGDPASTQTKRTVFFQSTVSGGGTAIEAPTGVNYTLNTWNHFAVVRISGIVTVYLNGQGGTATSNTINLTNTTYVPTVGGSSHSTAQSFVGYLSNFRILKGTGLYTTSFTPSTVPLTAITNTSLLTCQSNRFVDNSSNNFAITRNNSVSVSTWSPFIPTSAYSTSVNGGSGYLDGTGDYLSITDNDAFAFSTGNFTIETWIYPLTYGTTFNSFTRGTICNQWTSAGGYAFQFFISSNGSTSIELNFPSTISLVSSAGSVPLNAWSHIAIVRNGNNFTMYLNGVSVATTTSSASITNSTANIVLGRNIDANVWEYNGYISNLRIVKGTAVYTSAFTPPTAPLTAITNTSLLLNGTNAGIFDNAENNVLETVGNAQVSTSVVKYGTGSMAFDGNGDWLILPTSPLFNFGTGNFTIESWIWLDSTVVSSRIDNNKTVTLFSTGNASANDCSFAIYGNTSTAGVGLELFQETPRIAFNVVATVPLNQWVHIAYVRTGTTLYGFVNGVRYTLGTTSVALGGSGVSPKIGRANTTNYNNVFKGYLDDLRVTNGIARYTANFTPPTAAFPNL